MRALRINDFSMSPKAAQRRRLSLVDKEDMMGKKPKTEDFYMNDRV